MLRCYCKAFVLMITGPLAILSITSLLTNNNVNLSTCPLPSKNPHYMPSCSFFPYNSSPYSSSSSLTFLFYFHSLLFFFSFSFSSLLLLLFLLLLKMFRKHAANLNLTPKLDIIICDEGHRLKNASGTKTINALA